MAKDFGTQNIGHGQGVLPEQTGKGLLQSRKCFCGLIFDKVHEYKDCTVYYHAKGCDTVLTIPNKEK
jgi:hypothetical protein